MSARFSDTRGTIQTAKKSIGKINSAEVVLSLIFFGITGWIIGKARTAWVRSRSLPEKIGRVGSAGSGASCWSQASSVGSLPASAPRLTAYTHVRLGSKYPEKRRPSNDAGKAPAPRLSIQTKVQCKRCAKVLNWEEVTTPSRVRLKSPKTTDLLTKARSESKNTLRKLSRKGSFSSTKRSHRTILCFGDSNTWGYDPASQDRLECRWPVILSNELGDEYRVIEEGLSGRTINKSDSVLTQRRGFSHSGLEHAPVVLSSHKPLDLVILFLGINDLKTHLNPNLYNIIQGMEELLKTIMDLAIFKELKMKETANEIPLKRIQARILLMAPPKLKACVEGTSDSWFGEKSVEVSAVLTKALEKLAQRLKIPFLDTSKIVHTSELDSRHFGPEMHRKLGRKVAEKVLELFPQS